MSLRSKDGHADKGVSLARGPALVLGSILLAFGLLAFLADGTSPTDGFPDGTIRNAEKFLGFGVNDWTAFFTATAGGLLLFGAAQHLLAKTMSLLVGLALGACSVIALVDGDDVLGLAAANGWTKLGWGAAAAFLLINTLLPRKGGKDRGGGNARGVQRGPVGPPRREPVMPHREPVAVGRDDRSTRVEEAPATRTGRFGRFGRGDDAGRGGGVRDDSVSDDRR